MDNIWILAQASDNTTGGELLGRPVGENETVTETQVATDPNSGTGSRTPQGVGMQQMILFGLMAVFMYFILFRGPKKKQQQHKQMVQALKKNDKVRTIGGIFGTVVDIKDDEVTLKVDESNNTKIKISVSAIGKNLSNE